MCERTHILIVEDHVLLRELLAQTLAAEPDFEIAGQCATVGEALQIVSRRQVDLVLLDINLRGEQGGAFLNRSHAMGYQGKVLVITAGISEREAAWLLKRGCSGIFLKTEPIEALVTRIRGIMDGTFTLDSSSVKALVAQVTSSNSGHKSLTPREAQVLRAVCEGLSNKEIADRLGVSENSVKSFLQHLFAKTGVRTRAQLVAAAIEQYWDQMETSV
jgi:two-component system nitrate/nitrite response regulator NarL